MFILINIASFGINNIALKRLIALPPPQILRKIEGNKVDFFVHCILKHSILKTVSIVEIEHLIAMMRNNTIIQSGPDCNPLRREYKNMKREKRPPAFNNFQ